MLLKGHLEIQGIFKMGGGRRGGGLMWQGHCTVIPAFQDHPLNQQTMVLN